MHQVNMQNMVFTLHMIRVGFIQFVECCIYCFRVYFNISFSHLPHTYVVYVETPKVGRCNLIYRVICLSRSCSLNLVLLIVARHVPLPSPLSVSLTETVRHSPTRPDLVIISRKKKQRQKQIKKKKKTDCMEACFWYGFCFLTFFFIKPLVHENDFL